MSNRHRHRHYWGARALIGWTALDAHGRAVCWGLTRSSLSDRLDRRHRQMHGTAPYGLLWMN